MIAASDIAAKSAASRATLPQRIRPESGRVARLPGSGFIPS
jgi:hypothetical protein